MSELVLWSWLLCQTQTTPTLLERFEACSGGVRWNSQFCKNSHGLGDKQSGIHAYDKQVGSPYDFRHFLVAESFHHDLDREDAAQNVFALALFLHQNWDLEFVLWPCQTGSQRNTEISFNALVFASVVRSFLPRQDSKIEQFCKVQLLLSLGADEAKQIADKRTTNSIGCG